MIVKAYEYLFYKLYRWSEKVNGKDDYHTYLTSMMVSFVLMVNIVTIPVITNILTGYFIRFPYVSKYVLGVVALGFAALNYVYFNYKKRYLKILNHYRNESRSDEKKGNIVIVAYVIGSPILLFTSWFLAIYVNQIRG